MWRRTERASLEKKPSTRLSQEPCLGVKVNSKRPVGCSASQSFGFLGNVRGMIVEDQLDRRVGWIGGVEKLEEFDEFAAAVAILDQSVNRAGEQVDAGQQADRARGAYIHDRARRSRARRARAADPGRSWLSPGCRASRRQETIATASLGFFFDAAAVSLMILTWR